MTLSNSSPCARVSRRRSLSDGCNIHLLVAITECAALYTQPEDDKNDEGQTKPTQCINRGALTLALRSKSESIICTAQGVKFEDKYHKYQSRLASLVALAANPASSNSNSLLAKKALQYRNKTMERRRAYS
ncbi:hypothetical protein P3T76_013106 [Phytophthora citrophthora]|uniref:Uncharacterized protein n=1 Tax=Phytophthora citrophthora TaxID=4793 RepID=A0AAD9G470_9STRA|nr:hypothetical protein P3T76_013106 [Phytophthora citrophthora]